MEADLRLLPGGEHRREVLRFPRQKQLETLERLVRAQLVQVVYHEEERLLERLERSE